MRVDFIEATNGDRNWGKFMITRFDKEWSVKSIIDHKPMLWGRGWTGEHYFVTDLQTGEGAMFRHGGNAKADLDKRRIWVCPLFEPFLTWLYQQKDLDNLPNHVDLPDAPFELRGYRRPGIGEDSPKDPNPDLMRALYLLVKEWGGKYEIAVSDFASIPPSAGISVEKSADGLTLILKTYDKRPKPEKDSP